MLALPLLFACGSPPAPSSASAAVLSAADAHDGTVDHVVSECPGCGLGMTGSPEHAVTHEDYTLHFCSDRCSMSFESDPAAGLERLEKVVGP